jgi:uncharacterized protein (TIGR00266 family)
MMMYMEDGIGYDTKMGDGSKPKAGFLDKLVSAGMRAITGESLFLTHFTSTAPTGKRHIAFGAPYPGKIITIDLDDTNGELVCQKDSFLCAALGTELTIAFNKKIGAGLFGGEGFILQRLRGDGMVFVHAGGTIVEKLLNNERIMVDTGCVVAFENSISYDIQQAGNLKSMIFGGEGLFLATLHGTGRIWLQSLPFSRLADRILEFAPAAGGKDMGEGSIIDGAVRLLQQ